MIQGIEHTAIAAPDPGALAQWYVDTLGFTINYRGSTAVFVKAPNGSMIEFIPSEGDRGPNTMKTPGLRHLALTVDDFEAQYARLKQKGVNFLGEPSESKGNKVVFFTDPEGNILHLLQRSAPLP
ncbi:MAG: VOC family protein [Bryobacteraceae bacterium]|jgi:catechol 2,3-dioxygenase-like lactoylglutathione lyase family enzyme